MIPLTASQQRRRANGKAFRKLRSLWARVKNRRPAKDPAYLDWIRSQFCAVPDCTSVNLHQWRDAGAWIEAAHVGEIRGLRQKCSDREAIPLCAYHHRIGPPSRHVLGKHFWAFWELDRDSLIRDYNTIYDERRG